MSISFLNKKGKNYVPIITNGDVGSSALGQVYHAALHLITEFPDTIDLAFTYTYSYAFENFKALKHAPKIIRASRSIWDNPTTADYMFSSCEKLEDAQLFDVSEITSAMYMFAKCYALKSLPNFNFNSLQKAYYMFAYDNNIENLTNITIGNSLTSASYMFGYCTKLKTIPVLNLTNVTGNTSLQSMFKDCPALTNDTLNNILSYLTGAGVTANKTLKYVGLTEAQAQTCTTLSKYQDFLAAGWTTGYANIDNPTEGA